MKITINDVARESGVSKATVSYVLNSRQSSFGISGRTVAKVLDTVKRLNYKVDPAAVLLSEKKNDIVSILLLSPWLHAQFSDFMIQVSRAVEEMSQIHKLKISYEMFRGGELKHTLRPAKCKKFDAVLLMGYNLIDESFLAKNCTKFNNVVLLNRALQGYPGVSGNDREGAKELAEKVARRNAYEQYVVVHHPVMSRLEKLRIAGYLDGLKTIPAERIRQIELEAPLTNTESAERLFELCRSARTACFEVQYYPAATIAAQAAKHGFSVPDQIGIVSYDRHSVLETVFMPEMTTVDPRIDLMAKEAVQMCIQLKNGKQAESRLIPYEIRPGNSILF